MLSIKYYILLHGAASNSHVEWVVDCKVYYFNGVPR